MLYYIYILILGVVLSCLSAIAAGYYNSHKKGEGLYSFFGILSISFGLISFFTLIIVFIFSFEWKASEVKARIINREYKTSYTQEEIFYTDDVIDVIRELERKRIEINGNILENK